MRVQYRGVGEGRGIADARAAGCVGVDRKVLVAWWCWGVASLGMEGKFIWRAGERWCWGDRDGDVGGRKLGYGLWKERIRIGVPKLGCGGIVGKALMS